MKYCDECIHKSGTFCHSPRRLTCHKTGKVPPAHQYIEFQRKYGLIMARLTATCGKEGRWWVGSK